MNQVRIRPTPARRCLTKFYGLEPKFGLLPGCALICSGLRQLPNLRFLGLPQEDGGRDPVGRGRNLKSFHTRMNFVDTIGRIENPFHDVRFQKGLRDGSRCQISTFHHLRNFPFVNPPSGAFPCATRLDG